MGSLIGSNVQTVNRNPRSLIRCSSDCFLRNSLNTAYPSLLAFSCNMQAHETAGCFICAVLLVYIGEEQAQRGSAGCIQGWVQGGLGKVAVWDFPYSRNRNVMNTSVQVLPLKHSQKDLGSEDEPVHSRRQTASPILSFPPTPTPVQPC